MNKNQILSLFSNCSFEYPITENNYEDQILYYLPPYFYYSCVTGATKIVITPENLPFVIKIPFSGYVTEDYNTETKRWYSLYQPNQGGNGDNTYNWDYCAGELIIYNKAKQAKLNKAFCKLTYIGSIQNHPIYIQPKVTISNPTTNPASNSYFEDLAWEKNAIKYYGQKFFNKLLDFIADFRIWDLHAQNVGYINSRPVIIDYGSFNERGA